MQEGAAFFGGLSFFPLNNMNQITELLDRLISVRVCAGGWSAKCPAHADRNPSLRIRITSDGTILLKCFSGCSAAEIVQSLGLSMRDLFADCSRTPGRPQSRMRPDKKADDPYAGGYGGCERDPRWPDLFEFAWRIAWICKTGSPPAFTYAEFVRGGLRPPTSLLIVTEQLAARIISRIARDGLPNEQ